MKSRFAQRPEGLDLYFNLIHAIRLVLPTDSSEEPNVFSLFKDDGYSWDNRSHEIVEWSMKFAEDFIISIAVESSFGLRYLAYTPEETHSLGTETYIYHGLGANSKDGSWKTYIIDLGFDLDEAQPGNRIQSILGFYVAGSGRLDNIKTHAVMPDDQDSDGDTISDNDEIYTYGSHPYYSDTDDDDIADGDELLYWSNTWNSDPDNDRIYNLLDPDSDNDGFSDGVEINQNFDPSDNSSHP